MDDVEDGNILMSNDIFCKMKLHNKDESNKLSVIFNSIKSVERGVLKQ